MIENVTNSSNLYDKPIQSSGEGPTSGNNISGNEPLTRSIGTATESLTNNKDSNGKLEADPEAGRSSESISTTEGHYDTWKIVYFTMILHGVGTLIPWNMFITAKDYFVKYKLGEEYTGEDDSNYSKHFLSYVGLASQLPAVAFNWANIFMRIGGSLNERVICSLVVQAGIFFCTIILAIVDTSGAPATFFWLTMLSILAINTAGGIYQNCIYGIGGKLGCIGALTIGSNIAGTFASIVSLISTAAAPSEKAAACFYFSTALLVIFACLITFLVLPRSKFFRENWKPEATIFEAETGVGGMEIVARNEKPPYVDILKQCWPQCFNVFMVFFVSLTVFPAVQSDIERKNPEFFISEKYFSGVTCFLTFNLFALVGNMIIEVIQWPKPNLLWIAVILRLFFIPFFLFCNYRPRDTPRALLFALGDWIYWVGGALLGFTSGYFGSLAVIYCPKTVAAEHSSVASMFGVAFLVTGVVLGINFSLVMPSLIS